MVCIIATKIDKPMDQTLQKAEIEKFCQLSNAQLFWTSSKTGENVKETFENIAQMCVEGSVEPVKPNAPTSNFSSHQKKCAVM